MPKYEYACRSCGEHIEAVQSFADAQLTECPACSGPLRKVFAPPGISFKGSGFYRTDNRKRRTEPKETESKDRESSKDSGSKEAKGEGSSESKPAAETKSDSAPAKKESAPAGEAKPKAAEAKTA